MKKKLKKIGSDGLMIYFTKEEIELYGLREGDIIDLDDMIVQKTLADVEGEKNDKPKK